MILTAEFKQQELIVTIGSPKLSISTGVQIIRGTSDGKTSQEPSKEE